MDLARAIDSYSPMQKTIHWVAAGLIALQFLAFDGMGRPFRQLVESGTASYSLTVVAHIAIGLSLLGLTVWRLVLRFRNGVPQAPRAEPEIGRIGAKLAHGGLLLLMLTLPLTGIAAWLGAAKGAAGVHEVLTTLLMLLVLAHVAAVIVHQVHWKTDILRRMT